MCDQTEVAYLPDQVVWVKLGPIWWPGQVVEDDEDDEDVKKPKNKPLAVVKFFDEDNYQEVKNLNQIYHYNCLHKNDFIKKGLDMCRGTGSKPPPSSMKKFPEDIVRAEELTNGNVDILNDPIFLPEKTESLQVQLGFKQTPKVKKKSKPILPKTLFSTSRVESPRPESSESQNPNSEIRIQFTYPETNVTYYNCAHCDYRTELLELLQYHYPLHRTHDLEGNELPKRNKGFKRKSAYFRKVSLNEPKRKKKEENGEPKPKVDLRDNILKDWEEENEENEDSLDESSFLNETEDKEGDETKDSKTEELEETIKSGKDDSNSKEKSCFDFDEEDESINLDSSMKFGQKLPRVISNEKPKKQELPIYDEKDDFSHDLDNLLNETQVPKLPDIPDLDFSDKKTTNGDLTDLPEDEKLSKSPSWENSPLKKRRGSKTFFSDSERRSESPKIENSSPFKKRKALEVEEKPRTDINNFTNDFLDKMDDTPVEETIISKEEEMSKEEEEIITEPSKEVKIDDNSLPVENSKEKLEIDFLEKPHVTESAEVVHETIIENDNQVETTENHTNVINEEMVQEEKIVNESDIVIENEKSQVFQENVENEMIIEENIIEEKVIEEKVEDVKIEEKNIEKDPSEMDLDINSMPVFMGDELIMGNSDVIENTGTSVKQIKLQLKSDSKPGYFKDVNGKQIITLPGKKNVLLTKVNTLEKPTSSNVVQSPKKQVALNVKSQQLDPSQKIILLPADSSNGQNINKVAGGTKIITAKGVITQSKPMAQPAKKIFTKGNILASAQSLKPNLVTQPGQKLKFLTTKGPNQNVKFVTTSNLVSIQRPLGSQLNKKYMLIQSPSKAGEPIIRAATQIRPQQVRPGGQTVRPVAKPVQLKTVPQVVKTGAKVVPVNKVQVASKPKMVGPNILKQRKPPPKPVPKPQVQKTIEQQKMITVPASSVQENVKVVYLSVDGSYLPVSSVSSPMVTVEGSGNNMYLETSSADVDKLFLSIDENGQIVQNVSTSTKVLPEQDILAKALANTQVLGDNDSDFTNYPPLSLSHNVIETSFTMNQPIMTPQEVPSSVSPGLTAIDKKFQPLLSDDLESQTLYITENPSTSSHQQFIVLNQGNLVQTTASSTNLGEIIYSQEPSLLQDKNQDLNDPKTEFQIIQTQSDIELENNSQVAEEMVIEQVDSLNEPFAKSD